MTDADKRMIRLLSCRCSGYLKVDRRVRCFFLCILLLSLLSGCSSQVSGGDGSLRDGVIDGADSEESSVGDSVSEGAAKTIGLILTSQDADENEEVISAFEELAAGLGFETLIYIPDVTASEAEAALDMETGTFQSCDVNPIEYQMLGVDEMVAADADAFIIRPNHAEALDGVLGAARSVGICVITYGVETSEGTADFYTDTLDAALEYLEEL